MSNHRLLPAHGSVLIVGRQSQYQGSVSQEIAFAVATGARPFGAFDDPQRSTVIVANDAGDQSQAIQALRSWRFARDIGAAQSSNVHVVNASGAADAIASFHPRLIVRDFSAFLTPCDPSNQSLVGWLETMRTYASKDAVVLASAWSRLGDAAGMDRFVSHVWKVSADRGPKVTLETDTGRKIELRASEYPGLFVWNASSVPAAAPSITDFETLLAERW